MKESEGQTTFDGIYKNDIKCSRRRKRCGGNKPRKCEKWKQRSETNIDKETQ